MDVNAAPTPFLTEINSVPVIVAPAGWQTSILTQLARKTYSQPPSIIAGEQITRNNDSFAYYDQRFSSAATLYAVSRIRKHVEAQLDFHQSPESPQHVAHTLVRKFEFSKEFLAWKNADRKVFTQVDFANFLEDRIRDVSPEGETSQSDLMTAVAQFKANQSSNCTSATNLINGDVEFQFTNATNVTSGKFPTQLVLRIPMFEFGAVLDISARLKFRLKEGVLSFWYELIRIDEVIDDVFAHEVETLRQSIGEKFFLLED